MNAEFTTYPILGVLMLVLCPIFVGIPTFLYYYRKTHSPIKMQRYGIVIIFNIISVLFTCNIAQIIAFGRSYLTGKYCSYTPWNVICISIMSSCISILLFDIYLKNQVTKALIHNKTDSTSVWIKYQDSLSIYHYQNGITIVITIFFILIGGVPILSKILDDECYKEGYFVTVTIFSIHLIFWIFYFLSYMKFFTDSHYIHSELWFVPSTTTLIFVLGIYFKPFTPIYFNYLVIGGGCTFISVCMVLPPVILSYRDQNISIAAENQKYHNVHVKSSRHAIRSERIKPYLARFSRDEFSSENLMCWDAIQLFKMGIWDLIYTNLDNSDVFSPPDEYIHFAAWFSPVRAIWNTDVHTMEQIIGVCRGIYLEFINVKGINAVNIGSYTRTEIERRLLELGVLDLSDVSREVYNQYIASIKIRRADARRRKIRGKSRTDSIILTAKQFAKSENINKISVGNLGTVGKFVSHYMWNGAAEKNIILNNCNTEDKPTPLASWLSKIAVVFSPAQNAVEALVETSTYPRFLTSLQFEELKNDIKKHGGQC